MVEIYNDVIRKNDEAISLKNNIIDYKEISDTMIIAITDNTLYGLDYSIDKTTKLNKLRVSFEIQISRHFTSLDYSVINKLIYGNIDDGSKYIYNLQGKYIGKVGKNCVNNRH